jgi:hypothetical protein
MEESKAEPEVLDQGAQPQVLSTQPDPLWGGEWEVMIVMPERNFTAGQAGIVGGNAAAATSNANFGQAQVSTGGVGGGGASMAKSGGAGGVYPVPIPAGWEPFGVMPYGVVCRRRLR